MTYCTFCGREVDSTDPKTWRCVHVWVGGPKRNGSTLQSKPYRYACDDCIRKQQAGHAPDEQPMEF